MKVTDPLPAKVYTSTNFTYNHKTPSIKLKGLQGQTALGMPALRARPTLCSSGSEGGRQGPGTHAHGSHVILIGLPNFLHDLLLSPAAVLDGALHSDGPLGVIEGEVLQPAGRAKQRPPPTQRTGLGWPGMSPSSISASCRTFAKQLWPSLCNQGGAGEGGAGR